MISSNPSRPVTCPVCGQVANHPPLHRYTATQAAAHFCPPNRDAERNHRLESCIRRLWNGEEGFVYRCSECDFGFAWPYVGGDEEFYETLHEQAGYGRWRWEYDLTREKILPRYQGGRILDIGTGDGAFLKQLDQSWKVFATEGSDTTRTRLREDGIHCFASTEEAVKEAGGTFHVVTMFQVLEHIAEFDAMLAQCRRLLAPGGVLVVAVPNGRATFDQEELTGCADMTPNHVNKWSPAALTIAMRRAGLQPQQPSFEGASWRLAIYRSFLEVKARASADSASTAASIYRINRRPLRVPLLLPLAGINLLKNLGSLRRLRQGHSFLMEGLLA